LGDAGPAQSVAPQSPSYFHVLAKPTGAVCNLDCKYCFFLSKDTLYPGSQFRMTNDVLEAYVKQVIEPQITIAWQGGEPTLIGLDFFRRAMTLVHKYKGPGTTLEHTIQTNGVLMNEEWCEFLRRTTSWSGYRWMLRGKCTMPIV